MGDPQFLPSAYRKYAVSLAGGAPDIWTSRIRHPRLHRSFSGELRLASGPAMVERSRIAGALRRADAACRRGRLGERWGCAPRVDRYPPTAMPRCSCRAGAAGPGFPAVRELLDHQAVQQLGLLRPVARHVGPADRRITTLGRTSWPKLTVNLSRADKSFDAGPARHAGSLYGHQRTANSGRARATRSTPIRSRPASSPADGFATPELVSRLRGEP